MDFPGSLVSFGGVCLVSEKTMPTMPISGIGGVTELEECDPVSGSQKEGDERCHP